MLLYFWILDFSFHVLSAMKIWSVDHKNAVKYTNQADGKASTTKSLNNFFLGHPVFHRFRSPNYGKSGIPEKSQNAVLQLYSITM